MRFSVYEPTSVINIPCVFVSGAADKSLQEVVIVMLSTSRTCDTKQYHLRNPHPLKNDKHLRQNIDIFRYRCERTYVK